MAVKKIDDTSMQNEFSDFNDLSYSQVAADGLAFGVAVLSVSEPYVFLKVGSEEPLDISHGDGLNCGQPSLSENGHLLVFVKLKQNEAIGAGRTAPVIRGFLGAICHDRKIEWVHGAKT